MHCSALHELRHCCTAALLHAASHCCLSPGQSACSVGLRDAVFGEPLPWFERADERRGSLASLDTISVLATLDALHNDLRELRVSGRDSLLSCWSGDHKQCVADLRGALNVLMPTFLIVLNQNTCVHESKQTLLATHS
jgi:hypothetical protein